MLADIPSPAAKQLPPCTVQLHSSRPPVRSACVGCGDGLAGPRDYRARTGSCNRVSRRLLLRNRGGVLGDTRPSTQNPSRNRPSLQLVSPGLSDRRTSARDSVDLSGVRVYQDLRLASAIDFGSHFHRLSRSNRFQSIRGKA